MRKMIFLISSILALTFSTGIFVSATSPPPISTSLKVQILLDRAGFSPGEIDGNPGHNTKRAIEAFQKEKTLNVTGKPDEETMNALIGDQPAELLISYTIAEKDVAGPFVKEIPKDFMEQAKLDTLGYTSPIEALAEKFHVSPSLLKSLNKQAEFHAGDEILVPNVALESSEGSTASTNENSGETHTQVKGAAHTQTGKTNGKPFVTVIVDQQTSTVTAVNDTGDVVFYAPATLGSDHDPLPLGEWKIRGISRNPTFQYNPELFWDANPANAKAKLAPGPNNPVGVVWIDVSKEHYGLHGTPEPGRIGYSESYGCVRMTNWDASKLASIVKPGTKVIFQ